MKRSVVAVVLAASPMVALRAQDRQESARCVFDTAPHRDTVIKTLAIAVRRGNDSLTDPALSHDIGVIIRADFHPPALIGNLFYPNTGPKPGTPTRPSLVDPLGVFDLQLQADGKLMAVHALVPTLDASTDREILRVLDDAIAAEVRVRPMTKSIGAEEHVRVFLTYAAEPGSEPLVRVHVPTIRVDTPVTTTRVVLPRFPPNLQSIGASGMVTLKFVVGENGRAEPESIETVSAASVDFLASARDAVLQESFRPARSGACPVKMQVVQNVRFEINKS